MNNSAAQIEKIKFWSFLGPFFMLTTFAIFLLHPASQKFPLPFIGLIGLLISWKWKQQGLIVAVALLLATFFYEFQTATYETLFWDLLSLISMGLTMAITVLSFQELEAESLHSSKTTKEENSYEAEIALQKKENAEWESRHTQLLHHHQKLTLDYENLCQEQQNAAEKNSLADQKFETLSQQYQNLIQEKQTLTQQQSGLEKRLEEVVVQDQQKNATIQTLEKELAALRMANRQKELHVHHQASAISDLQAQIALSQQEIEQSKKASQEFLQAVDKKEELLLEQIRLLEQRLAKSPAEQAPAASPAKNKTEKKSPAKKQKAGTKTNNWANAIMSRWSE